MIEFLLKFDHEIINLDIKFPKNFNHKNLWIELDICNYSLLKQEIISFNPDYIIHLAARTDLNENKSIIGYKSNIEGVENLMNISSKLPNLKRIIIASSMLVCKVGYIPKSINDYCPSSLYGESKVMTEKIVKKYDFDWVIVRPTSIWGPWFAQPYFNFFKLVMNGFYFNIKRDSAATKTYGYVKNTCIQISDILFSSSDIVKNNYFYLGDSVPINITDWSHLIRFSINKRKLITIPLFVIYIASLFGDFLRFFRVYNFPLNTFRYYNMTTDNVIKNLNKTELVTSIENHIDLKEAVNQTIDWINRINK